MFYNAQNKKDFLIGWIMGAMTIALTVMLFRIMS
jgi:gas vesicle protein